MHLIKSTTAYAKVQAVKLHSDNVQLVTLPSTSIIRLQVQQKNKDLTILQFWLKKNHREVIVHSWVQITVMLLTVVNFYQLED